MVTIRRAWTLSQSTGCSRYGSIPGKGVVTSTSLRLPGEALGSSTGNTCLSYQVSGHSGETGTHWRSISAIPVLGHAGARSAVLTGSNGGLFRERIFSLVGTAD